MALSIVVGGGSRLLFVAKTLLLLLVLEKYEPGACRALMRTRSTKL